MPAWPDSLPWEPNNGNYKETPPDTLVRDQNDVGPATVRRRTTAGIRRLVLPYRFTPEQTDAFDDFLMNDLKGGSLSFTFNWPPPPRQTRQVTARIASIPTYEHKGAGCHDVTLELEILP